MTGQKSDRTESAGAATKTGNLWGAHANVEKLEAIPEPQFREIERTAEQGRLTEPDFQMVWQDQVRAKAKRKVAIHAGNIEAAASASSRDEAVTRLIVPYGLSGVRSRKAQKKGGEVTAGIKQQQGKETKAKVHELATTLLASHRRRDISGMISQRLNLTRPQVLAHLRDHPSGEWK